MSRAESPPPAAAGLTKEKPQISGEFQEALKSFVKRGTTASWRERHHILRELNRLWKQEATGVSEGPLQAILQNVGFCLPRYIGDSISCRELLIFVKQVLETKTPATYSNFLHMLSGIADPLVFSGSSKYAKKLARLALKFCVLVYPKLTVKSEEWRILMDVQSKLLFVALHTEIRTERHMVLKIMKAEIVPDVHFFEELLAYSTKDDASIHSIGHVDLLVLFLCGENQESLLRQLKTSIQVPIAKYFSRLAFSSKAPLSTQFLGLCETALCLIDPPVFKEHILSPLVKAMLRNPEVVLPAVLAVLKGVRIDLSPHCLEMGKLLATQLHSKLEAPRKLSAEACKHLAQHCLDSAAVDDLAGHIFGVLGGSEGKIAAAPERLDLLCGLGNLSCQAKGALPGSSDRISSLFLSFVTNEAVEAIALYGITMFSLWAERFQQIPTSFLLAVKGIAGQKSSVLRVAYLTCLSVLSKEQSRSQLTDLVPVLTKIVDSAVAKPADNNLRMEALPAACVLLDAYSGSAHTDPKQQPFWNSVFDSKKQLFTSEKFLQSCGDEGLKSLLLLVERLFLLSYDCMKPDELKAPHDTRRAAFDCWEKVVTAHRHGPLGVMLLASVKVDLIKLKRLSVDKPAEGEVRKETNYSKNAVVVLCKVVDFYVLLDFSAEDKGHLIVEALLLSHEPGIVALRPGLWLNLLQRFHHDSIFPDKLITESVEDVWTRLLNEDILPDAAIRDSIKTFISFPTPTMVNKLLNGVKLELHKPDNFLVTLEDVLIFATPAGILHDKSVLDVFTDNDTKGNVKRESKAYSFKEQMAEMELRKELEAKKKASLKGKEVPLTAKQKEALAKQLAKESAVRQAVQVVYTNIRRPFLILDAMITANPDCLKAFLNQIISIVSPLLHAPLMAHSAYSTWLIMGRCVSETLRKTGLANALAMTTLRVLEPSCSLPSSWSHESLNTAVSRVINGLYRLCTGPLENGDANHDAIHKEAELTVSDVCFAFPLIQLVVQDGQSKSFTVKEDVTLDAFRVLCKILEVCAGDVQDQLSNGFEEDDTAIMEVEENNPAFLPLPDVLRTLIAVGENNKRLEVDACAATAYFAKSVARIVSAGETLDNNIVLQLLNLFLCSKATLRFAAVQALTILRESLETFMHDPRNRSVLEKRLCIASYDTEDLKVAEVAADLFQDLNFQPHEGLVDAVLEDVVYIKDFVRNSAAAALGIMLPEFEDITDRVLTRLLKMYSKNIEDCILKVDRYGRPISENLADQWPARRGIAAALINIAPCLNEESLLLPVMEFLLDNPCALKDEKNAVRNDMLQVGITLVEIHGKAHVTPLLTKFEQFLANTPKTGAYDVVRQNAIVIMGTLAKHLDSKHPKIRPIVHQLLAALSTPSEEVQKAVGSCIAPLVSTIHDDIKSVVPNLLHVLYESDSYAHRRGAAYGLAGVFQGLGIMALKDYDIMLTVMEGLQDKKNPQKRESSLLAISMLSLGLGRVFEPFVIKAIPHVLQSIGDGNIHVRQAAEEASKGAMSQLSGPGVKLVLPALLGGLEEDAWRAKVAAIEMLGDMAFCAPRQLSSSLPVAVPKLIETLGDSHNKVQESAVSALKKIASVIKNPEVTGLVPGILTALQDPAKKTTTCLKTILQTQFIHVIDAPSLALLMPVIRRAIYDRGTENRKLSAQIMASLYSLADQKDLLPYLEGILPGLKNCLLDPAPEVRLCAAKAIAALVSGTGEPGFDQLKEWLFARLVSENNSVDRSGAAQGLAESLGVLGVHKLREMTPQFLKVILDEKTPSHVRDGYLLLFVYLPVVFGQLFSPFISDLIPAILFGLADDTEYVRETALQCGQRIVTYFADSAIELLLPQLEEGMFDENWRIRYASVQLLGDLLYKIAGASGKHTTAGLEEDENFGTEQSHSAILHRLGENHRNRVLAGLYISRSDNALVVRQAALHVWKVIVTNTPKTLREVLPELFEILLDALASDNEERRQVAAKTLGELVRKLGERILPEIIPILQDGLDSEADEHREGVCVGLMEIISSSSKETVVMYCDILEPTLAKALLDPNGGVRRAAAEAFCMLDNVVGHKILDDILPVLFDKVTDPVEGDRALDGLQQIMARRSRVVLPYLIPRLTTPPVNTKTLALLTAVAGEALSKHLGKVLPSLLTSLQAKMGTDLEETELGYCRNVILSVDDEAGVNTLVESLMQGAQNEKTRLAAVTLLDVFFGSTKVDVRGFFVTSIRPMMRLYVFDEPVLIKKVASIIGTLIKKTPTDVVYENVAALRTAIRAIHMEVRVPCIPGLCLPEGAAVFIPMLRDALLSVSADEKELVGQTIGDLVRLSSQTGLKTSVVTITGPIIRILGDRYGPGVRTVMLDALNALIEKCTTLIKPFVPQIQTTVSRALSDPTRSVRIKAGIVAANIAPMHPRLDTLANDLLEVARTNADFSAKETSLRSLRMLLGTAGQKLSAQYRSDVISVTTRYLDAEENDVKLAASGCLGALCRFAADEELAGLLKDYIYDVTSTDWSLQHGHCLALGAALKEAGDKLISEQYADATMDAILKHHTSDRVPIVVSSTRCMGLYVVHQRKSNKALNKKLLIVLAKSLNHSAVEVKQLVAQICSHLAYASDGPLDVSDLKLLVPQIVNGTKEKNTAVRYDSEMALADVLHLRKDDSVFESLKAAMDVGARESLQNARKSISKSVMQNTTKLEELDETL